MRQTLRRIPANRRKVRVQKIVAPRFEANLRVKMRRPRTSLPPPLSAYERAFEPPMPAEPAPVEIDADEVQAVVRALEDISREVPPYESYEVSIELGDADIVESIAID